MSCGGPGTRQSVLLAGVLALVLGVAAPVVGFWAPLRLAPAGGSSTLIPDADTPRVPSGAESDPLLSGAPWEPLPLPSSPIAAVVQGTGLHAIPSPIAVGLPDVDALELFGSWLADEPLRPRGEVAGSSYGPLDIPAGTSGLDVAPRPALYALQSAVPAGQDQSGSVFQISGILMYRLFTSGLPPADAVVAGGNVNALTPTLAFPTIHDGTIETAITWRFSPTVNLFVDLALENTTGTPDLSASDIEQAYFDVHGLFGIPGSRLLVGRERIKLGLEGLLLDESVFDGGRRDGIEVQLSQLGPVSLLGFVQYALDDGLQVGNWMSTRRVWGASAQAELSGWTVNVAFRTDTAGNAADAGTVLCPGTGCNIGTGWSAGVEGNLARGVSLVVEVATYTLSGDVARWYYEASVAFDLQQLALPAQPVLTFWYKSFDPYTLPLDAPLGHLKTPGDFGIFNTNDNLTAVGARLDVTVSPALSLFGLAEWGTYKGGGPNYNVLSAGVIYNFSANTVAKVSYNSYVVDGGIVVTSPMSGLILGNAEVLKFELTRSF